MKKDFVTTRWWGIAVLFFTVVSGAGAATSVPESAKAKVERPASFNESAVADI